MSLALYLGLLDYRRIVYILGAYDVGLSTTAIAVSGGIPDGTWNTIMTLYEDVPKHQQRESMVDYALSPGMFIRSPPTNTVRADSSLFWTVVGRIRPRFQLFYHFSIPGERPTAGWFLPMQPINRALVQRTFGLLELQALDGMAHLGDYASAYLSSCIFP